MKKIHVLQFICPVGFYGAERWVLALANNLDPDSVVSSLAVTMEPGQKKLEIVKQFTAGPTFEIDMKSKLDFTTVKRLVQVIKENQIDIIHTHGYKSDILGYLAARSAGIKCVSTPHGFEGQKKLKLAFYVWLGCFFLRFYDKVVPLSRQLMDEVREYRISPKITEYIQNGVDLKEVESARLSKAQSAIESKSRTIGFIGQMIERKNIVDLLDVFEILWNEDKSLKLILVGDGPVRASLENYASTLSSKDHIQFLGFRQDRLELLHSLRLFLMTSISEGIPRCMMESMAMGIPMAAYDIAGVDQLIKKDITGVLAPLGDKEELARQCSRIINDDAFATTVSNAALDFVNQNFAASRMAKEYTALFNKLI